MAEIAEIKDRYRISQAWSDEGLKGLPGKEVRSPFRDDKNPSFSVFNEGRSWKDHGSDEGGDVLDFICLARGCEFKEAKKIIEDRLSLAGARGKGQQRKGRAPKTKNKGKNGVSGPKIQPMPDADAALWEEGVEYLARDSELQEKIDAWRGWNLGTSLWLVEENLMGAPQIRGNRCLAFTVSYPISGANLPIGFHAYFKGSQSGKRSRWGYYPSGLPGVPFILNAGGFSNADLVIVLEGQWDACAWASAAGYMANPDIS